MSERFNSAPSAQMDVDAAFDAEKRQAQSEYDAYLQTRPYQDELGNIHNADNGQFITNPNTETDEEYYNRMIEEADTGSDMRFAGKGLKELAEMVKEATDSNDKTLAIEARAAFDDKFISVAEKLGWEGVVTLEDGTIENRNEIAEKRLAYYEGLMDGKASPEPKQKQSEPEAEVKPADTESDASDEAEEEPEAEVEVEQTDTDKGADSTDTETNTDNVDAEVMLDKVVEYRGKKGKVVRVLVDASTGERMLHLALTDEKGHIDHATVAESEVTFTPEQAVDTGLDSGDTINPPVDTDMETDEALPAVDTYLDGGKDINPAIDTDLDADTEIQDAVDTDLGDGSEVLDAVDTSLDEEEEVLPPVDTSLGETNWQQMKTAPLAYLASRTESIRSRMRDFRDRFRGREDEPKKPYYYALGATALVATVAGAWLMRDSGGELPVEAGAATSGADIGASVETPDATVPETETDSSEAAAESSEDLPVNQETLDLEAAGTVDKGEGWNQTMKEMGIPESEWKPLLAEVGPELGEMSYPDQPDLKVAYFDVKADEWRINMPESGKMPQAALDLIEQARSN